MSVASKHLNGPLAVAMNITMGTQCSRQQRPCAAKLARGKRSLPCP
jgi:hypothetical protein